MAMEITRRDVDFNQLDLFHFFHIQIAHHHRHVYLGIGFDGKFEMYMRYPHLADPGHLNTMGVAGTGWNIKIRDIQNMLTLSR